MTCSGQNPAGDRAFGAIRLRVEQEMDEGIFYGLFFTGILINYSLKLHLENKGSRLERGNIREGIIMGVSAYLLYQTMALPEIPFPGRVIAAILGLAALVAGGVFFVRGRLSGK